MQVLRQYSIQFKGLKFGNHKFEFDISDFFFKEFPDSLIKQGQLKTVLELERKSDHLVLIFNTSGKVKTECDRCTAGIDLPLDFSYEYIIKFDEDEREEDEIIYIHPESHDLKLSSMIYEQIILALPIIKVYNCEDDEPKPCNEKVLAILYKDSIEEEKVNNPFGEVLKDLKITKTK